MNMNGTSRLHWFAGRTWLLFGTLCMLLILVVAGTTTFLAAHAASAGVTAPSHTVSYYEYGASSGTLHSQGCSAAKGPIGVVVLDFGEPWYQSGKYGTRDFASGAPFITDASITSAAESFAQGVWACRTKSFITVAIGTSNYGSHVTNAAGVAWGNVVKSVEGYITSKKYNTHVGADGAIDAETEWNSFTATSSFVKGFNTGINNKRLLWDYGDDTPGYWSDYDVWYVASGAGNEGALPEIYYNADATLDWAPVARWACSTGRHMRFMGAMAEAVSGQNSPAQAFDAMYNALGTNSCTQSDRSTMHFSTDI